jgi:hypothetical protein
VGYYLLGYLRLLRIVTRVEEGTSNPAKRDDQIKGKELVPETFTQSMDRR